MNHSGIYGTFFQNDPVRPLVYGEVNLINPPRRRLRGEPEKEGILVHPVIVGFCGTDHELMMMGKRGQLGPKFPAGQNRLINGHEGVVWVPSQNRFAIVLRGVALGVRKITLLLSYPTDEVGNHLFDEDLLDEKGSLHMEKARLVAYSHGLYHQVGKVMGFFGYSVARPEVLERRMKEFG